MLVRRTYCLENHIKKDVTDIFVKINSTDVELSRVDFTISKISLNDNYGGSYTRKLNDYFCHILNNFADQQNIKSNDKEFSELEYLIRLLGRNKYVMRRKN